MSDAASDLELLDADLLAQLFRHMGCAQPLLWAGVLAQRCIAAEISPPRRLAAFAGTIAHETGGFRVLKEDLQYRPETLRRVWPSRFTEAEAERLGRIVEDGRLVRPADEAAIAEIAYGGRMGNTQPGDGHRFIGRGLIQLTGRHNYARLAEVARASIQSLPAWLETPEGAAEAAVRYWTWLGCNAPADEWDLVRVRKLVNGGRVGLADVARRAESAREFLRRRQVTA